MTTVEKLLREAWEAGFQAATDRYDDGLYDIPVEHFFEKYIEQVVDALTEARGEE